MKQLVEVTREDIRLADNSCGRGFRTQNCAIARALKRTFKTRNARWFYEYGKVNGADVKSLAPRRTTLFVTRHDRQDGTVSPIKFYVETAR